MIRVKNHLLIIDREGEIFFGDFLDAEARVFGKSPEEVIEKAREISHKIEVNSTSYPVMKLGTPEEI